MAKGHGQNISGGFNTTNIIVLDVETPVNLKLLGTFMQQNMTQFQAIVAAYKMRLAVVRSMFPQSSAIGIYGSPNGPDAFKDENFTLSMEGYRAAAKLGLFDYVDMLVPVLYFGNNDTDPRHDEGVFNFTKTTMDAANSIVRSDGSPIPIYANTKFTYGHGNGVTPGSWVEKDTTHKLIAILEAYPRLARVMYWFYPDFYPKQPDANPELVEWWFRTRTPVPAACFNRTN